MTDQKETLTFNPDDIPCQEISDPAVLSKTPLVSVKMITYNHEPYIAQAIEGVLMQETDFPIELVIGEDCSTDRTREIVMDYQKKHPNIIRVITSDHNVGAIKNGCRTERACRGKYIAYCEGDDYWHHPQKLQKQVDILESQPEYGLVHSEVDAYNVETGQRIRNFNRFYKKRNHIFNNDNENPFFEILVYRYKIRTCTVCVRKKLLDHVIESDPIAYATDRFMMGDTPRWLDLSRLTKFKYIDESLATYNQLPDSLSNSKDIRKKMKFRLSSFDKVLYYADKYGCTDKLPKSFLDQCTHPLLSYSYHNQDSEMAVMVKEKRKHLPFQQRLMYWGSINPVMHLLLWPLVYSARFIRKLATVLRV